MRIMVPGRRVVPCERKDKIFGTEKMRSLTNISRRISRLERGFAYSQPQSCMTFPFFNPLNLSLAGSGINSVDTSTGPRSISQRSLFLGNQLTNRTSTIKPFTKTPLRLRELSCATANIIRSRIPQHIF